MNKPSPRAQRVADQIQRILADLIRREIRDPRVGMVSVTGVNVSRDFAYANVFVTVLSSGLVQDGFGSQLKDMGELDRKEIDDSLAALNKAAGYLRSLLGKELSLRTTPALKFHYDDSIARGSYLSTLIDKALAADSTHEHLPDADDESDDTSSDNSGSDKQ
ncbi:30S ribosome-binding factor RbfA [Pseudohongiella sp.]|uniref:Ribosome-binding factor A n=1 Tax=marine sediment metagenome TaxID=412755 RepID=A0A0F9YQE9_9ZZZZ|nr:30S ribosome-binding factor RbfA [Pseudohongiella sp.]HDZ10127.1 30S ribosome-binding factor RbfA [Pseudohongiella sp.]HEA63476.1 30S ribosome-binding factor RbfA [Pseudohongiella sp.]